MKKLLLLLVLGIMVIPAWADITLFHINDGRHLLQYKPSDPLHFMAQEYNYRGEGPTLHSIKCEATVRDGQLVPAFSWRIVHNNNIWYYANDNVSQINTLDYFTPKPGDNYISIEASYPAWWGRLKIGEVYIECKTY